MRRTSRCRDGTILWTSSNQAVATVDAASGVVAGVGLGTVQIRATADGVQGVANVTVGLVRVSSVSVTPANVTLMPSQTAQLSATPRDSAGTAIQGPALGGRSTAWTSSNTAAATVGTFGLVTGVAQGASTITATIGGTIGQAAITVSPLPTATQLSITTQPSASAPNDAAFPVQPVVQLKDVNGNNVSTAGIVISAAITAPGTGTLGGTVSAATDASGAATFTNLKITGTIGARTLTFSSGALTPATSSGVNVTPGAATQLVLTTPPPSTANSGQAFASPSALRLQDISGNNVLQAGVLVTTSVSPSAGVTLGGGSTTTDASGTATFGGLTLTGPAGGYTLTFSSGALTPAASGTITLSAGSGSKLSISTPPPASVPSGQAFGVAVQLLDGSNNPVAQAGVTVTAAISSGGPTLGGTTNVQTDASGVATFSNLTITGAIGASHPVVRRGRLHRGVVGSDKRHRWSAGGTGHGGAATLERAEWRLVLDVRQARRRKRQRSWRDIRRRFAQRRRRIARRQRSRHNRRRRPGNLQRPDDHGACRELLPQLQLWKRAGHSVRAGHADPRGRSKAGDSERSRWCGERRGVDGATVHPGT